jgi:hypothetical protein
VAVALVIAGVSALSSSGVGGNATPRIPNIAAPPTDPIPPRNDIYTTFPAACSMLSDATVQSLNPGAVAEESPPMDRNLDGFQQFSHSCDWEAANADYVRFVSFELTGVLDNEDDPVETVAGTYTGFAARLADSTNIVQIEGQHPEPNLGDEANIIYGIDTSGCRTARLLIRSQNAKLDVTYGGCDRGPGELLASAPMNQTAMMNGVLTMARDALQHLNAA